MATDALQREHFQHDQGSGGVVRTVSQSLHPYITKRMSYTAIGQIDFAD